MAPSLTLAFGSPMTKSTLVASMFAVALLRASEPQSPALGGGLPAGAKDLNEEIMTTSSQTRKHYHWESKGVVWSLGVSDAGRVVYVATKSRKFRTPERISAGTTYAELRTRTRRPVLKIPGFAYFVTLPSGWRAALVRDKEMTSRPLADSTPVSFLYQTSD